MAEKSNVFISFSFDSSVDWKDRVANMLTKKGIAVDYSEKVDRSEMSDQTIWKYLRNRIVGSSVTLVLYSKDFEHGNGGKAMKNKDNAKSWNTAEFNEGWIYKELRASLADEDGNPVNGVLVVMPNNIYSEKHGESSCKETGKKVITSYYNDVPPIINKNQNNVISSYKKAKCKCCFDILHDSFITIISESTFESDPTYYIEETKKKRDRVNEFYITRRTE